MTPYTVGVVVDMGTFGALGLSTTVGTGAANPLAVNEQTTIAAMTEMINDYEFVVHAGDIAYADYWLKEEIQNYLPTTTTAQGAVVYEQILNAFYDEVRVIYNTKTLCRGSPRAVSGAQCFYRKLPRQLSAPRLFSIQYLPVLISVLAGRYHVAESVSATTLFPWMLRILIYQDTW